MRTAACVFRYETFGQERISDPVPLVYYKYINETVTRKVLLYAAISNNPRHRQDDGREDL